jgi:hypothetical protein
MGVGVVGRSDEEGLYHLAITAPYTHPALLAHPLLLPIHLTALTTHSSTLTTHFDPLSSAPLLPLTLTCSVVLEVDEPYEEQVSTTVSGFRRP